MGSRRSRSRTWRWVLGILAILLVGTAVSVRLVTARAQPILRARVIKTLATRFKSRVELAELDVSIAHGLHVKGKDLEIYGSTDPNSSEPGFQPLIRIGEFRFQTALSSLFRTPMRVDTIYVDGLVMNVPPKNDRQQLRNLRQRSGKLSIAVDRIVCVDAKLIINTAKPGNEPLEFDIKDLRLKDIGPGQPLRFDATLVNPKPVGDIQSQGQFGPLNDQSPRDSSVAGDYSFTNADLGTLRGLGGILSSNGHYAGTLGRIEVEGQTDTPDFRINISGHPVPLQTDFHAIVDGTDGNTYLDPVRATVLHSSVTAKGKIVRVKNPPGHDIELEVVLGRANIEDLLTVGVKTAPPIMAGAVAMNTKLSLLPGKGDLTDRLNLAGTFHVPEGHFTNQKVQSRIDSFSLRSQGKSKLAQNLPEVDVPSDLQGTFSLHKAVLSFSFLHFQVPGTHADMNGEYSLDGNTFDFHGTLKLRAKLSQITTGWKSILLKPIDPFFEKHGAGAEVPFTITGTRQEPHFGLDFHHKHDTLVETPGSTGKMQ